MARIDDMKDLVEKVMGWSCRVIDTLHDGLEIKHPTRGRCYWWKGASLRDDNWDPYTDANAALEVVQAMSNRGYEIHVSLTDSQWNCEVFDDGVLRHFAYGHATMQKAICAAALDAVRSEQ